MTGSGAEIGESFFIEHGTGVVIGETVIGRDSVIGGNVWITESIPPGSRILGQVKPNGGQNSCGAVSASSSRSNGVS